MKQFGLMRNVQPLYAKAIYSAMIWGREVNEQNQIIQEKNNSVK